jgi:hypothetical protein
MRQHFWPKMEIKKWDIEDRKKTTYVSSLIKNNSCFNNSYFYSNKSTHKEQVNENMSAIAFTGYKHNLKLGPGVIYFVREGRQIDTHLGAFVNDKLDNEATIFRNGKLVYDGGINKGVREGFATQRYYFEIEDDVDYQVDEEKDRICYLEYRGNFVNDKRNGQGEVHFYGNLEVFADYFLRLKEYREQENANAGVFDSFLSERPIGIPVITNHVDSKFNIEKIFKTVPVVQVDSQEDFEGHFDEKESKLSNKYSNVETSGNWFVYFMNKYP